MALTKVTYAMIEDAPINVNDYGADSTGTTVSTSQIQAAINAAQTAKRPLVLNGAYLIDATLSVTDGLIINGNNSTLKPANTFASTAVISATPIDSFFLVNTVNTVVINNLVFSGIKPNTTSVLTSALTLHATENVTVNNCYFDSWGFAAITNSFVGTPPASYSKDTLVNNCTINYCGHDLTTTSNQGTISAIIPGDYNIFNDCVMFDPTNHGFVVGYGTGSQSTGCTVIFTGATNSIYSSGFYVPDSTSASIPSNVAVSITSCSVINEGATEIGNGIKVSNESYGTTVGDCKIVQFTSSVGAALNVQSAQGTKLLGNYVTMGSARAAITVFASDASFNTDDTYITNNTVVGFSKASTGSDFSGQETNTGVVVYGFARPINNVIIESNKITIFNVGVGLYFDATNVKISNNEINEVVTGLRTNDTSKTILESNSIVSDGGGVELKTAADNIQIMNNTITSGGDNSASNKTCVATIAAGSDSIENVMICGNRLIGRNTTALLTYAILIDSATDNVLIANNQCTYTGTVGNSIRVLGSVDVVVSGNMTADIAIDTAGSTNVGNVAGSNLVTANY
jgi:hypothetical protein